MKKILLSLLALTLTTISVNAQQKKDPLAEKASQYATVPLKADLGELTDQERELVSIFIDIAKIMDEIYWEQTFGTDNYRKLREIKEPGMLQLAMINYGAWDRMDGNKPFIPGYGAKPAGANFYPADMTKDEFEKLQNKDKTSPYTIIRRGPKNQLMVIPYSKAYGKHLQRVDLLLNRAIELAADNDELRNYLETRREALHSNDYHKSDMAWMDMKKSRLDFVFGPIENYEDGLFGYKTSFEAFVLIKDEKWSQQLEHITSLLSKMQDKLPCKPEYKKDKPGTESDIYVYDAIYYAGECNAGGKTIAINLPNDERVQLEKGTRRLQLKNTMQAKFDEILMPISKLMIAKSQTNNVKFDAFFNNVCFHEVAHGLGMKHTVNGKQTVREALKNQYSAWEEAKADICGLYMVQTLIEEGEIKDITVEDAYVTYMAGLLRSVRFGATEAHGIANIMCFNFMQDKKAFNRDKEGRYQVDMKMMRKAIEEWAALVLKMEGDGDYKAASSYAEKNGKVRPELKKDLLVIAKEKIPVDIVFKQGHELLGLKPSKEARDPRGPQAISTSAKPQFKLKK